MRLFFVVGALLLLAGCQQQAANVCFAMNTMVPQAKTYATVGSKSGVIAVGCASATDVGNLLDRR
jgi:hypothetical protein